MGPTARRPVHLMLVARMIDKVQTNGVDQWPNERVWSDGTPGLRAEKAVQCPGRVIRFAG
jgi:hypothetical protein